MKKSFTRIVGILAIVVLAIVLPACESTGGYSTTTYVTAGYGYGYGVYGGYYGAGWGAASCCYGGGAVVVRPPVYAAPRVGHY